VTEELTPTLVNVLDDVILAYDCDTVTGPVQDRLQERYVHGSFLPFIFNLGRKEMRCRMARTSSSNEAV
jgi:hypothetical protein